MQVDEDGAIPAWIPANLMFNANDATFLVLHKTAGFHSALECAQYFQSGSDGFGVSAHYIIGQDGAIIQCVPEARGAGANCCANLGHAQFIPQTWNGVQDNGNLHSIAIEHIDPSLDNSTPLTLAQKKASFSLVLHICKRHNIPARYAVNDGLGGICGHKDIDPVNRSRCPGNYPWTELFQFLRNNMSDYKDQQAAACWSSTTKLLQLTSGKEADFTTPIAQKWLDMYKRGLKPGPPLTIEYQNIDWSGTAILMQEFSQAHAEMDQAGKVTFFDLFGTRL